jgi:hypothetical protein
VKIKTTYIPSDTSGQDVNFQLQAVASTRSPTWQKLGADLAAAGVGPTDSLMFDVSTR